MFNSPVLDLVILLSFTYFVGSLMLSTINESLSALLKTRANDLKKTLENLLFDDNKEDNDDRSNNKWANFAKNTLFKSQHIQSLMNNKNQFPSYIPAQNFILAIIEELKKKGTLTQSNVEAAIESSSLPDSMKGVMKDLLAKAQANVSATKTELASFEQELEGFYNNAMERATGWYKRKVRRIMLLAGFVIAAVLNIDTIKITNDALSDTAKLSKTVGAIITSLDNTKKTASIDISASGDSAKNKEKLVRADSIIQATGKKIDSLTVAYNQVGGYQLGYKKGEFRNEWWPKEKGCLNSFCVLLLKILGLLLTAFALQLGSNYWFDLLNKAVNLRATGVKPDQKQKANK